MSRRPWDLVVIGGGTAGIVGAKTAARLGARVLLIERERTGGDCLWTGCVPSKSLLAAAHAAAEARAAHRFGVLVGDVHIDFEQVRAHVRAAIETIEPIDSPNALRAAGVTVLAGSARFTAADSVVLGSETIRFRRALIATGAAPSMPAIDGLDAARTVTSETVWDRTDLPARLLVLGGGNVGCELGQAFARLGSSVVIVEPAPTLLTREDPAAVAVLRAALEGDGVDVRTGCSLRSVHDGRAELSDGSSVGFDVILVAVGRAARTADLDLPAAEVEVDDRGQVTVDAALRTSNPRVFAAGDVTTHPQFTHLAGVHASTAASNAVLGLRRRAETDAVPRVTFTHPELAAVGVPPAQAASRCTIEHADVDRAVTDGSTGGHTTLGFDRRGRVVGAVVVGPRAGEVLAELTLAIGTGMKSRDLAATIHAYPTYADGAWKAAIEQVQGSLRRPAVRVVLAVLRWRARR